MALEVLEDMKRRGLGKDKHSLNAAIAACASAGRYVFIFRFGCQPVEDSVLSAEDK